MNFAPLRSLRRQALLHLAGTLLLLLTASSLGAEEPPAWLAEARAVAIETAAGSLGLGIDGVEVAAESVWAAASGEQVASFKIHSLESSDAVEIGLAPDLSLVDLESVRAADREAAFDPSLVIDPSLADEMAEAHPDDVLPILVWLHTPPYEPPPWPEVFPEEPFELEAFDQANAAALEEHLEPVFSAFAEQLDGLGLASGRSENAPLVWTDARVDQIHEIASWPETSRVYREQTYSPLLANARVAVSRNLVPFIHPTRVFPAKSAVVDLRTPLAVHPALRNNPFPIHHQANVQSCMTNSEHTTAVVGVILSQDSSHPGIHDTAKTMAGVACSLDSRDVVATTDLVIGKGAWVINYSWGHNVRGAMSVLDRYVDQVTRNRSRTFVTAAGNQGDPLFPTHHVATPATAYNSLAVGAADDRNTSTRMDDTIAGFSAFIDPASRRGDRIKPDLVAPGVDIVRPAFVPWWTTDSGTSLSAPMVTAVASLLLERQPFLHFFPGSLRSVLLASATNNVEGGEANSEKDGAGGLDAFSALRVATGQAGGWGSRTISCAGAPKLEIVQTMRLEALFTFRAASSWTVNPEFPNYRNEPGADLDLLLLDPSGRTVASSVTFDSNTEVIAHIPLQTGTFSLAVRTLDCRSEPGAVGFAWWHEGNE